MPPRPLQSTFRVRLITDNPIWQAHWSIEYENYSNGDVWDLFELSVHGQPALAAAVCGEHVIPRFYIPGTWERIFIDVDGSDTVPLRPN